MTRRWRLVNGAALYDIGADPGQEHDVAAGHPGVVEELRAAHEAWWNEVSPGLDAYSPISLGNDHENRTRLDAMDVMGDVAWHQTSIVLAQKSTGRWTVDVEQPGEYSFRLRRWPDELGLPIDAAVSREDAAGHIYADGNGTCNTIQPVRARLKLFDQEVHAAVEPGMDEVTFKLSVTQTGVTRLEAWFSDESGDERGAYYVYVKKLA